ncbi:hypothetical protein B7P43_G16460 [Cryptotermes secundus]|uniref:Uncharacterized protein n=1 Tax=Cryptotermes secundus TaxID=105785 RepID=A0A2J7R0D0_9NEOP|nr:hypothetical protein B7P43_G16460 [Cryptotermes secundus]
MPLAWIHNLPREYAEKFASELGVSVQGTLDYLPKKLKDKWRALEACLPPHITDKFAASTDVAGTSMVKIQRGVVHAQVSYAQNILSVFLPPRIRESPLSKYALDLFKSHTEDLAQFIMSVLSAAGILEYQVSESALVRLIV